MMLMRRRFSADTPELRCLTRLLRTSVATTDRIVRVSTAMLGFGAVAVVMSDPPDWITLAVAMSVCALVVRVTIPAAIAADETRIAKLQMSFEESGTDPPTATGT